MRGISKFVSRAKTSILLSTTSAERTVDHDFDSELARYKVGEGLAEKMIDGTRHTLDSMKKFAAHQVAFESSLMFLSDPGDATHSSIVQSHDSLFNSDQQVKQNYEPVYKLSVIEPAEKNKKMYSVYNEVIAKRRKRLLDVDTAKMKLKKLTEKPQQDTTLFDKAQAEHAEVEKKYRELHDPLVKEIPIVVSMRTTVLGNSVEAAVQILNNYNTLMYSSLANAEANFASGSVRFDETCEEQLFNNLKLDLSELRVLSLCSSS